uniref:Uncharacterized protein n=1 Tax=Spongospora subterranea TaxID=70186 RepID=A0A0H5RDM4_9EUKA|eukprot:CRZ12113.1 hypothetical protein [Spongospora subterranea]
MREVNRRPGTALPLSRHSPADPPTSIRHNKIVLSSWDKERFLKIQRQLHLISEGEVLLSTPRDLVQEGVDIPEQEHAEGQDEKQEEIRKKLPVEDLRNPVERNLQRSQTVGRIKNRSAKRHLASCLSGDVPKTLRLSSSVAFLPRHAIRDRRFYRLNKENSWNNIWRIPACRQKYATCESRNQGHNRHTSGLKQVLC